MRAVSSFRIGSTYDSVYQATETGQLYQILLELAPAAPRVAHPLS